MNKLKVLIIVIVVLILANMTVMVFLSEKGKMADNSTGATIVTKKRDFTKTVTIQLMVKGGLFAEKQENNGIGALFSRVWVKSNKILETVEYYGGNISAKVSPFAFEVRLSIPTNELDKVYSDFETFLVNPVFDKEIFEREKVQHLDELKTSLDNPNLIAQNGFMALAFEGSPYAMPLEGEESSVKNIKYEDIESYYKVNIKSSYIVAVIAGNFNNELEKKLSNTLSKLDKGSPYEYDCTNSLITEDKRKEVTDSRIKQSKVYIGYNAPDARSEDYAALKVLTDILGGGMSSRYFTEIRKNSSYAYAVGAGYPSRYCSSRFFISMGLDYKNVESAINKIEEINFNLKDTITEQEIEKAKKSILGSSLMETQSNGSLAWTMAFFETMGLGADYYEKYVDVLKHIKKEDLIKAAEIFKGSKAVYILKPEESK